MAHPRRVTGPTAATKALVDARDGGRCVRCGVLLGEWWSRQHRIARGMGGTRDPRVNLPANLVSLCGSATSVGCHRLAERRDPGLRADGYVLYRSQDPRTTPLLTWRGWVTLDDEGGWAVCDGIAEDPGVR